MATVPQFKVQALTSEKFSASQTLRLLSNHGYFWNFTVSENGHVPCYGVNENNKYSPPLIFVCSRTIVGNIKLEFLLMLLFKGKITAK